MATTFNPHDKSANVSLSGGNLVVVATTSADGAVRSFDAQSIGKFYFEVTWTGTLAGAGGDTATAVALNSTALTDIGTNSVASALVYKTGHVFNNSSNTGIALGSIVANDVICCALDLGNKKVWFRRNGGSWNNSGTDDPATNTGGVDISGWFDGTSPVAPAVAVNDTAVTHTANFGGTSFAQTAPSGFTGGWPVVPNTAVFSGGASIAINATSNTPTVTISGNSDLIIDATVKPFAPSSGVAALLVGV